MTIRRLGGGVNDNRTLIRASKQHELLRSKIARIPVVQLNTVAGNLCALFDRYPSHAAHAHGTNYVHVPDVYVQMARLIRFKMVRVLSADATGPGQVNEVTFEWWLIKMGSWSLHHHLIQEGEYAYNSLQQIGPSKKFKPLYEHHGWWQSLYLSSRITGIFNEGKNFS